MHELIVRPRGYYSLALSARLAGDATRTFRDGVLQANLGREIGIAWQGPDGRVTLRAGSEGGIELLRFVLALDDDHTPFLQANAGDPLLGKAVRHLRGLRPVRLPTVTQALLRALCGQLIEASRARQLERRIVAAAAGDSRWPHPPPSGESLARFSAAELRALGLHARRAATLLRLLRSIDLERLRTLPTSAAAARLERERGLGPWSVGLVCLEGLGRYDRGLVGDLGLIKLCSVLRGRRADAWETAELLEPYGEWAGLAGTYLLTGWAKGLVPVPLLRRRAAA
jgi:3-methyladenine DNA glycosylase/8-oxoguanine DNA glycosylase